MSELPPGGTSPPGLNDDDHGGTDDERPRLARAADGGAGVPGSTLFPLTIVSIPLRYVPPSELGNANHRFSRHKRRYRKNP